VTWTKLSDDFADDCWTLSDAAFRLHVDGLVWSNRKLLDLRIPKTDLRRMSTCTEAAAAELVACDWWADLGDVYVIRHHGVYQRDRAAVLRQQEVNQANGAKGGRLSKPSRERRVRANLASGETESLSESQTETGTKPTSEPDGTGRARTGRALHAREETRTEPPTQPTPGPVAELDTTCRDCGQLTADWVLTERDGRCIGCDQNHRLGPSRQVVAARLIAELDGRAVSDA
jgi:hypothetical protein